MAKNKGRGFRRRWWGELIEPMEEIQERFERWAQMLRGDRADKQAVKHVEMISGHLTELIVLIKDRAGLI